MKRLITGFALTLALLVLLGGLDSANAVRSGTPFDPDPSLKVSVESLAVSPSYVTGGATAMGTVTLDRNDPSSGASVSLQSSHTAVATAPASVTVPGGLRTASFPIATSPVNSNPNVIPPGVSVTITATRGTSRSAGLEVAPPMLQSFTVASPVTGGNTALASVILNGQAGSAGVTIALASSNPSAFPLPPSITVPAGATSKWFNVQPNPIEASTTVTLTATRSAFNSKTVQATVVPPRLASVSCPAVQGGSMADCSVHLTGPTPSPRVVALQSSSAALVTVPSNVTVSPGTRYGNFQAETAPVAGSASGSITATLGPDTYSDVIELSSPYLSIDMARAARDQYGGSATIVTICEHLYCWRAQVGTALHGLDVQRAVETQYGAGFRAAAVGVHLYDWRAVATSQLLDMVLPALLIPGDRFFDLQGVRDGIARYSSLLRNLRSWYRYRAGVTFSLIHPLVVPSGLTAAEWRDLSEFTTCPDAMDDDPYTNPVDEYLCPPYAPPPGAVAGGDMRWGVLDRSILEYEAALPTPHSRLRVTIAQDLGTAGLQVWWGAAQLGRYAVGTPQVAAVSCPANADGGYWCGEAGYAIGHELGHAFAGLKHPCDDYDPAPPNCADSIMQTARPWGAILLDFEAEDLRTTSFFR